MYRKNIVQTQYILTSTECYLIQLCGHLTWHFYVIYCRVQLYWDNENPFSSSQEHKHTLLCTHLQAAASLLNSFELHTGSQMPHVSVLDTCIAAAWKPLFHLASPGKILDPTSDTLELISMQITLWYLNALLDFKNVHTLSLDKGCFPWSICIARHLISCAPGKRKLPLLYKFSLSLSFCTFRTCGTDFTAAGKAMLEWN